MTAFQRMSLLEAKRVRGEMEQEQVEKAKEEGGADVGGRRNAGALNGGGGTITEHKHFSNASLETGKSPEQLIKEHKEQNG